MDYQDWRDNINSELLYRYWSRIGSPGVFLEKNKYGIEFIRELTPLGELKILNYPLFGLDSACKSKKVLNSDRKISDLLNWKIKSARTT